MAVSVTSTEAHDGPAATGFWALTLGSIGVVFGDIGTSPLYAFREALAGAVQGQPITRLMVLGVLSLILWALFTVQLRAEGAAAQSQAPQGASANDATDYFQIPTGRVVEAGTQVTI
jgi:K+ transporter